MVGLGRRCEGVGVEQSKAGTRASVGRVVTRSSDSCSLWISHQSNDRGAQGCNGSSSVERKVVAVVVVVTEI